MNVILDNLTLFCYILSTLFHWLLMAARKHTLLPYAVGAACVGFLVHTGYLSLEVSRIGSMLFSGARYHGLLLLDRGVSVSHRRGGSHTRTGVLFDADGTARPVARIGDPARRGSLPATADQFWLITHVVLALLGNAAFALTFCGGIMYLIQDSYLKAKQPGGFRPSCLSLEMLDRLNFWALAFGLPLLTQGIITGAIWARYARGSFWFWERTTWPLIVMWGIYMLLFVGRWYLGWRGRRAAFAVIVGFAR